MELCIFLFLLGARSPQNYRHGAQKNFHIQPQRPIVDILQIQTHPFLKILHFVASADLPEASQPRLDAEAPAVRQIIKSQGFIHGQGPGTHQTHLSLQHIEQLGQLIETPAPQWMEKRLRLKRPALPCSRKALRMGAAAPVPDLRCLTLRQRYKMAGRSRNSLRGGASCFRRGRALNYWGMVSASSSAKTS